METRLSFALLILASLNFGQVVGFSIFSYLNLRPSPYGRNATTADASDDVTRLGTYSIYRNRITLSGFSSGGGIAQQLQISYSSKFSGIAVFQHGFYRCGPGDGNADNYDNACTIINNTPWLNLYNPDLAIHDIKRYLTMGIIENPQNLHKTKLYVYTGTNNWIHSPGISLRILNIYEPYIRNNDAIMIRGQIANLTLPTNSYGGPCAEDAESHYFLSNCGLSGPFEALNFLLGDKVVRHPPPRRGQIPLEPLQTFNQTEFTRGIIGEHWMDIIGFLYVPTLCKSGLKKCYVHFYFHGCTSGREFVGKNHIENSGFLEIAELSGIIIVFPQIVKNDGENGWGCWDTYGLTGKLYATQQGAQVTAVNNMLSRILGEF